MPDLNTAFPQARFVRAGQSAAVISTLAAAWALLSPAVQDAENTFIEGLSDLQVLAITSFPTSGGGIPAPQQPSGQLIVVNENGNSISGTPSAGTAAVGGTIAGAVPSNTAVSDPLNRAVENPLRDGTNWAQDATYGLDLENAAAGQMTSPTASTNAGSIWQPAVAADQEAYAQVEAITTNAATWGVIKLRWQSITQFYRVKFQPNGVAIFNGAGTQLQESVNNAVTISAGDFVYARVYGSPATIEAWHSTDGVTWALIGQVINDSHSASGKVGFAVSDPTVVLGPPVIGAVTETSGASWQAPAAASSFSTFVKDGDVYSIATKNGVVAGSGQADQSAAMATFLGNCIANNKVAVIPAGDYNLSTPKYIQGLPRILMDGVRILCGHTNDNVWNFFGGTGIFTFAAQQDSFVTVASLTADAAIGATTINVPTAGILAGDVIAIGDQATLVGGNSGTNTVWAKNLYHVRSITSSSALVLSEPLIYPMTVANQAYVQLLGVGMSAATGAQGGFIHGGLFQGTSPGAGAQTSTASAVRFWSLRNLDIETSVQNITNVAFQFQACWKPKAKLVCEDIADFQQPGQIAGQVGYGALFAGCCAHGDIDMRATRVRHAISFAGTGHNCWGHGEASGCTSTNFDMHAGFTGSGYSNIFAHGGGPICALRGDRNTVKNARGDQTQGGVYVFDVPLKTVIENVDVINPTVDSNGDSWAVRVDQSQGGVTIQGGRWINMSHGVMLNTTVSDLTVMGVSAQNLLGSAHTGSIGGSLVYIPVTTAGVTRGRIIGNSIDDNQGSPTTSSVTFAGSASITDYNHLGNFLGSSVSQASGAHAASVTVLDPSFFAPVQTVFNAAGSFSYAAPGGSATKLILTIGGGGGGGGSGRSSASGTAAFGGGGGGGGGFTQLEIPISAVTFPVTVTVGAGGAGGAAQATASTNGNNGTGGGASSFGSYARAPGGNSGAAGTTTTGAAGTGSTGQIAGGSGGAASATTGGSSNSSAGSAGGGGGGSINTTPAAATGGAAAACTWNTQSTGGGAGAVSGAGGNAVAATLAGVPGAGGGGGGSSITAVGGAGGTGSAGGGGGGSGAGLDANGGSGAGGKGGDGFVVVYAS